MGVRSRSLSPALGPGRGLRVRRLRAAAYSLARLDLEVGRELAGALFLDLGGVCKYILFILQVWSFFEDFLQVQV